MIDQKSTSIVDKVLNSADLGVDLLYMSHIMIRDFTCFTK